MPGKSINAHAEHSPSRESTQTCVKNPDLTLVRGDVQHKLDRMVVLTSYMLCDVLPSVMCCQ